MIQKLHLAAPYNIFYNTIPCLPQQDNTIFFTDLLCPSLGKLKTSLQITFKVDIEWLMNQYDQKHLRYVKNTKTPTQVEVSGPNL